MHVFLATSWLDPFTHLVAWVINFIDLGVHNRGLSLVLFALVLKIATWPLNGKQFQAMLKMQKLGPQLKAIQDRHKAKEEQLRKKLSAADFKTKQLENQQALQAETMELYKREGANPLAGCWPILVTYPFIGGVYYAVTLPMYRPLYAGQHFLWIGSQFTQNLPALPIWKTSILATSLTAPDLALLIVYAFSMYLFSRYATMPSTDPQQAQVQKMTAIIMPLMFTYLGFQAKWPSAMVLYWLSFNIFTMAQQFYLLRKFHQPLSVLDNEHAITDIPQAQSVPAAPSENGSARQIGTSKPAKKKKGARR